MATREWPDALFDVLKRAEVAQVGYVPDAGHRRLIERCHAARGMRTVVLTTEEEGVALCCGAWLGGQRSVLLMQSSGVGNCINMLGMVAECRFPLLMLVTMRGEAGESNPWQVPMGQATAAVLAAMGVVVERAESAADVARRAEAAATLAFVGNRACAVLVAQGVIGFKGFGK
ncbi:MAG: phosphonopyruvate decarboxylase [Planctomycetes bacterium]|nr:phosphonopyruvate decarboxylase [Planctomycetota bacterium]